MPTKKNNQIVVYQAKSGALELRGDISHETIWASIDQIAVVFGRDKSVISRHLKNIFAEKELDKNSVVAKNATTAKDGKIYLVEYYNLDAIISVGYRVSSKTATHFRQWATKILREHIVKGYTLNRRRIAKNYDAFIKAVWDIQALLPEGVSFDPKNVIELVKEFASTWVSLEAYDKEQLKTIGATQKAIHLAGEELTKVIQDFRLELMKKGEATDIFATERTPGSITGIVGNVMQSFGGKPVYLSIEEKAAHLLYFIIKDHPFIDGNKRSGSFAFVWFLRKAKVKAGRKITWPTLTALALLIAESDRNKKDQMTALITQLIK